MFCNTRLCEAKIRYSSKIPYCSVLLIIILIDNFCCSDLKPQYLQETKVKTIIRLCQVTSTRGCLKTFKFPNKFPMLSFRFSQTAKQHSCLFCFFFLDSRFLNSQTRKLTWNGVRALLIFKPQHMSAYPLKSKIQLPNAKTVTDTSFSCRKICVRNALGGIQKKKKESKANKVSSTLCYWFFVFYFTEKSIPPIPCERRMITYLYKGHPINRSLPPTIRL